MPAVGDVASSARAHRLWAVVILTTGVAVAVALHQSAGTTFPVPWPDEIDFLTPAANLARHATLNVPQLNAPHGMFWVPDFFYILIAPVFRVLPTTVAVGRGVSLAALISAAIGFWVAGSRAGANQVFSAAAVVVWLVTPAAVLAGNTARQEAIVLAFVAWSIAATVSRRRVLALALATLGALAHPAGAPFLIIVVCANGATKSDRHASPQTNRWEWIVAGLAVGLALFQLAHLALHLDPALDQLRFQLHRKADHPRDVSSSAMALYFVIAIAAVRRWRSDSRAILLGAVISLAVVRSVGQEIWYGIYEWPTGLLLLSFAGAATLRRLSMPKVVRQVSALPLACAIALPLAHAWAADFQGMRFHQRPEEWSAFVASVHQELLRLSASSTREQVVLVNDLSGLPWPLEGDRVGPFQHSGIRSLEFT